eukprot:5664042-Amphidinium_carterae.1
MDNALYVMILRVSIDTIEVVRAWVLTAWSGPVACCVVGVRDVVGCSVDVVVELMLTGMMSMSAFASSSGGPTSSVGWMGLN